MDLAQFPLGAGVGDPDADDVPNPTFHDFLPKPGSPAINAGWAGEATHVMPLTDMLGNSRQIAPDIGALEAI